VIINLARSGNWSELIAPQMVLSGAPVGRQTSIGNLTPSQ